MCLARTLGADADEDPLEWNEHCAGDQSTRFNRARGDLSADRWEKQVPTMFFLFASFTVVYFLVVAAFLPETKGKTLEEIEAHFEAA